MEKCLVYENSLKFSRAFYGILAFFGFLIHNLWIVLATSLLMLLGAISFSFNLPYQFHATFLRKWLKDTSEPLEKEKGEIKFPCAFGGSLLLFGFLMVLLGKYTNFAWILILMVSLLMLLASFTGVCVASLMYATFKKIFKK